MNLFDDEEDYHPHEEEQEECSECGEADGEHLPACTRARRPCGGDYIFASKWPNSKL